MRASECTHYTPGEQASFEAGIKLGALYHQWSGTPVSPATAAALGKEIAASVSLQPFMESCEVDIDPEALRRAVNRFGYAELRGEMFTARVETAVQGARARAELRIEDGYPLMRLLEVRRA